jgi:hypothetical protein
MEIYEGQVTELRSQKRKGEIGVNRINLSPLRRWLASFQHQHPRFGCLFVHAALPYLSQALSALISLDFKMTGFEGHERVTRSIFRDEYRLLGLCVLLVLLRSMFQAAELPPNFVSTHPHCNQVRP